MATIIPVRQSPGDFQQLSPSGASFSDYLLFGALGTGDAADLSSWLDTRHFWELGFQLYRQDFGGGGLGGITVNLEGTNIVDPAAADPDVSTPVVALGTLNAAGTFLEVTNPVRFIRAVLAAAPGALVVNISLHAQGR